MFFRRRTVVLWWWSKLWSTTELPFLIPCYGKPGWTKRSARFWCPGLTKDQLSADNDRLGADKMSSGADKDQHRADKLSELSWQNISTRLTNCQIFCQRWGWQNCQNWADKIVRTEQTNLSVLSWQISGRVSLFLVNF
jgi:hypothetical protein